MNLSLLVSMLALLVTSVIISEAVFSVLPITSSFSARQVHTMVSYIWPCSCSPFTWDYTGP